MVTIEQWILTIGIVLSAGATVARLMWKLLLAIGIIITAFGLLNIVFGWVK